MSKVVYTIIFTTKPVLKFDTRQDHLACDLPSSVFTLG